MFHVTVRVRYDIRVNLVEKYGLKEMLKENGAPFYKAPLAFLFVACSVLS